MSMSYYRNQKFDELNAIKQAPQWHQCMQMISILYNPLAKEKHDKTLSDHHVLPFQFPKNKNKIFHVTNSFFPSNTTLTTILLKLKTIKKHQQGEKKQT